MQIRTDIKPAEPTKVCTKCGANKPVDSFSLLRGKHSSDRKSICVQCETKSRKAKKQYGMELEEMESFLSMPCCICGAESTHIELDNDDSPIGVLCSECHRYTNYASSSVLLSAYNFSIFILEFPFYLKWLISKKRKVKDYPLLDWIDREETTPREHG